MIMSGGFGNRMWSWRDSGLDSYKVYYTKADEDRVKALKKSGHKVKIGGLDRQATIDNMMRINPQLANAYITRWYTGHDIGKQEARELRTRLLTHLLQEVAPQAAVILDRDLLFHKKLIDMQLAFDGNTVSLRELAESRARSALPDAIEKHKDDPRLIQLILDAETVTRYLLNGADGKQKMHKISFLGNDNTMWAKALMFDLDKDNLPKGITREQVLERAGRVKQFMLTIRDQIAPDLITKGAEVFIPTIKEGEIFYDVKKPKKKPAWMDAIHIRSFPGHYTVRRYIDWGKMGERVTARMLGDNDKLVENFEETIAAHKANVLMMQEHPEKMKAEAFQSVREPLQKSAEKLRTVHGSESMIAVQSSVQMVSYVFIEAFNKWFHKGTAYKYIPFDPLSWPVIRDVFRSSSWVHAATGSTISEIESQESRTMINKSVDASLIAPYNGYRNLKGEYINDKLNDRFPNLKPGRFLPKVRIPAHEMVPIKEIIKILPFNFKVPVLAPRSPYNATRLVKALGAENWNLALNAVPEYAGIVLVLLALAALQRAVEDTKEQ